MKQSMLRILSLVLILTLLATSGAMAFEFKDTSNMSNSEMSAYQKEFNATVKEIPISLTEFQNTKPVLDALIFVKDVPALWGMPGPWYAAKLQPLSGFEELFEGANYPGYGYVQIYTAETKNGKYEMIDSMGFSLNPNMNYFCDGCAVFRSDLEKYNYAKIRYAIYDTATRSFIYTKYSDAVEIPVRPAAVPDVTLYKVSSSEIFAEVTKVGYRNESRVLQIREKGTKKWYSVSKSPLVKSYEASSRGYMLKVDSSKDYEVRARNYRKVNDKKYYSNYEYEKKYSNPIAKVTDVSFLRYDKNGYVVNLTDWYIPDMHSRYDKIQAAYRKSGTSKWSYTTKLMNTSYGDSIFRHGAYLFAKDGYEYKFRVYTSLPDNKKAAGPWSEVFKCTNNTSKFVNEASLRDTTADHIVYDHSKTYRQNFELLQAKVGEVSHYRLWDKGMSLNYEDFTHFTARIDHSRQDEDIIGVHVFGGGEKAALLEMLCLYAEDNEVAYALFGWRDAIDNYGNANSDYFGFRDVKYTENGFIIEMNGQQIEVEKTERGSIFWFDMTD